MAGIKEITALCKAGKLSEAYESVKTDIDTYPQQVWPQRGMGWVLYYMIKNDIVEKKYRDLLDKLDELSSLQLLSMQNDSIFFDNVIWKLAEFIKVIPKDNFEYVERVFSFVKQYTFVPSKGYSYFLKVNMHLDGWEHLEDFFVWWNLDNLLPEDYQEFKLQNGKRVMSLAEQAYIAYSKVLLKLRDNAKIRAFIPKIETLMDMYPNMLYPGYFCGKLMLALGTAKADALKIVMPFVRKKKNDFWVWQLLSEIFHGEPDNQMACLLKAVSCKTKEEFLGKVRIKLVSLYLSQNDYSHARFHMDKIVACYMSQGWHLPFEVQDWIKMPQLQSSAPNSSVKLDFVSITNKILRIGTNESIAVVTYVDNKSKKVHLVYGDKKRCSIPFFKNVVKAEEGNLLKLYWFAGKNNDIVVVDIEEESAFNFTPLSYVKQISGKVDRKVGNSFAFIKEGHNSYYVSPSILKKNNLNDGDIVTAIVANCYNTKMNAWKWQCLTIK